MRPVTSAAIIFAVALAVSAREISRDLEPRIVGGVDALDGQYPYSVSLRVYFEHFCGGSILNNRWVLTAARCLTGKRADEISVIAGTIHLSEAGQLYQAILIISHPNYSAGKDINDVGLIRVSRDIVFTPRIQPIRLPAENFNKVNASAILTGWGITRLGGDMPEILQELDVTVISQAACIKLNPLVGDRQICAQTPIGEGACQADAGDALIANGAQIGIASTVKSCGNGQPDVFTRVWTFVNWIKTTIQTNN